MTPLLARRALAGATLLASLSAQADWRPLTPAVMPPARAAHAMAFDSTNDRIVLFAGGNTSSTPLARAGHAMAYDPIRGRVVLFGGYGVGTTHGDTWEWDGQNWAQKFPQNRPGPRGSHPLVYSPVRGTVVTWGGYDGTRNLDDMWEWDGTNWRQIVTATRPQARRASDMAFDPTTGGLVMYSGYSTGDDTWTFDNVDWTQRTPTTTPGYRVDHMMMTDMLRQRVVLFGSYSTNDTWEWTGSNWVQRTPTTAPPARNDSWMVFDSLRNRIVMFGLSRTSTDMWEYGTNTPASWSAFGSGCTGTNRLAPNLSSPGGPWLGENHELRLDQLPATASTAQILLGLSNTTWGSFALPLVLAPLGMPGCDLLVEPLLQFPISLSGGTGSMLLPVPNRRSLRGLRLFSQALVLDLGANAAGVVVSNGGVSTVGAK